ncbi:MAG: AprI/Inh family metalloprotease inhibitor [Pseudomonadota bacterium]
MARTVSLTTALAAALLVSGCGNFMGSRVSSLPASPTQPVAQQPLGPMTLDPGTTGTTTNPDGTAVADAAANADDAAASADGLAGAPGQDGSSAVAALSTPPADADANANVGRADLLGGWKISSGPERCQLFMNLTSWQGGYRATTRGCSSPALQNIAAWDLNGSQVTLKDSNGAAIGTVYPTQSGAFSGQTAGGKELAFSR